MKSILYYRHVKNAKFPDGMKPIYYEGPFWAFWLIDLFSAIAHFGWETRSKIEDRFTRPADKRITRV